MEGVTDGIKDITSGQELHHEIFGSVLDRTEMTPYLLLRAGDYETALGQATKMMGNRGFDTVEDELHESEKKRALKYVEQAYRYFLYSMFPFVKKQLEALLPLNSGNAPLYRDCLRKIGEIESTLHTPEFRNIVSDDPRHLFLLASSRKYPRVFYGYRGGVDMDVPRLWQQMACSLLKMAHLIKSIEEDSQDINDYAQLGMFLEEQGQSLEDLYNYDWQHPELIPENEAAQRAFVKISTFFLKLRESLRFDHEKGCLVFNSGDGVEVDIADIKSRLKSPESMFTKLGKDVHGEAHNIRDILAITFILKSRDDTLKLFHALQKRGVILQENTISHSITQTLFDSPESMIEAVRRLMISLCRSEGKDIVPDDKELLANARSFYNALGANTAKNPYSSSGHKKFQCKINFCVPVHRKAGSNEILIPGTPDYMNRHHIDKKTEQHTLALELRISDEESWRRSEHGGDSHHDAYKFRQLIAVMNRVFKGVFYFPEERFARLREDQRRLFPGVA